MITATRARVVVIAIVAMTPDARLSLSVGHMSTNLSVVAMMRCKQ